MKFKTLLARLLATYMLIAVVTIVILAVLATQMLRFNSVSEGSVVMKESADKICEVYSQNYGTSAAAPNLIYSVRSICEREKLDIQVLDRFGVLFVGISGDPGLSEFSVQFENELEGIISQTQNGEDVTSYFFQDNLFGTPIITMGVPLKYKDNSAGTIIIHNRMNTLDNTLGMIYSQLLIAALVSAGLAFVLVFFTSKRIERPIIAVTQAAAELGAGNFEKRLSISDSGEIGQLASAFNQMADQLEKYEKTRTSFVANVSHELKSPLTSIQGFVAGMIDGTIPTEDYPQYLEIVHNETCRVSSLITELLDLAKFESGQFPLNITDLDIYELIRRCFINFLVKIDAKKINVVFDVPEDSLFVSGDSDRLAQVLTNLIDNAVKFTPEEGQLKIWTYLMNHKVYVNVSNSGSPIPGEDLPFLFDRFFKVDKSHNRNAGGTGIGLSIVKNIIAQLGEDIWVVSNADIGTIFTFTLSVKDKKRTKRH